VEAGAAQQNVTLLRYFLTSDENLTTMDGVALAFGRAACCGIRVLRRNRRNMPHPHEAPHVTASGVTAA